MNSVAVSVEAVCVTRSTAGIGGVGAPGVASYEVTRVPRHVPARSGTPVTRRTGHSRQRYWS